MERFTGLGATVADFWTWAYSDLRANTVRGVLAEFLVACAVGAEGTRARRLRQLDVLAPDGTRIEVKSSAYLQSWTQKEHSKLSFGRLRGLEWDASRNEYSEERSVRADVFVFAIHTERDPNAYDALELSKWEFYVVARPRACPAAVQRRLISPEDQCWTLRALRRTHSIIDSF